MRAAASLAFGLATVIVTVWLGVAPGAARAQCDRPVVGDHLFSNEPAPLPCVEPPAGHPPIRFGVGLRLGGAYDSGADGAGTADAPGARVSGGVIAHFDLALHELFEVGARVGVQLAPDRGVDADGDGLDDQSDADATAILATAGPRLVLHTNAARDESLRFSVDFGALVAVGGDARTGPVIEVGIERQVGALFVSDGYARKSHGTGLAWTIGVHLQQGLGDVSDHRAAYLSLGSSLELGVPLPRGARPPRKRPVLEHTFSANAGGGVSVGERGGAGGSLELGVGFPIGEVLALEAHGTATVLGRAEGGDPTVFYAVLGGVRAPRYFPIFVQVLAGYAFGFGTQPLEIGDGAVLDIQAGVQLANVFGCGIGTFLAVQNRFGLSPDNDGLALIGFTLGLRHDSLLGAATCEP